MEKVEQKSFHPKRTLTLIFVTPQQQQQQQQQNPPKREKHHVNLHTHTHTKLKNVLLNTYFCAGGGGGVSPFSGFGFGGRRSYLKNK